ncbi:MAG: hypothetical protein ACYS7Y_28680 [Planctomycetota bacterium]|jgi:hypothetical protein
MTIPGHDAWKTGNGGEDHPANQVCEWCGDDLPDEPWRWGLLLFCSSDCRDREQDYETDERDPMYNTYDERE